jgi:predicted esterase
MEMPTSGRKLDEARAAVVMLHGRGGNAKDILALGAELGQDDIAFAAPQAPGNSWYPFSFLAPFAQNEPFLSQALAGVAAALDAVAAELPPERIVLLGFSQGGCLALEFVARNARRYGGVAGLSAGLIGPRNTPRTYSGSMAATPVILGCSDVDPHIPLWRVQESTRVLRGLGAEVSETIYPGMGHTINQDEIARVRALLERL